MAVMLCSGLQSAVFSAYADGGAGMPATQVYADLMSHDCVDCEPRQDCCGSLECQMILQCSAFPAMTSVVGRLGYDRADSRQHRFIQPALPSALIYTIYRPPWA
ncbi:MAG TPA: hypothetical protein ENG92_03780 [Thiolapillus brandeum]|uniref:Uncharacterized protein n=1 Tax=Thiolapillus brandeum TaxID=1076588 RepID=A0A831K3Q7_9GAMM|nr:hypothetical protein [Thiolapillus brandeum]